MEGSCSTSGPKLRDSSQDTNAQEIRAELDRALLIDDELDEYRSGTLRYNDPSDHVMDVEPQSGKEER
ncbi:MAG: hypothetical protein ACOCZB_04250 [Spirochaetota bacterium]